jgi:hypothetical protein
MSADALVTYLNDHLAGSVAAVELVERATHAHEGTALGRFFQELGEEIKADQETLRDLLTRVDGSENRLKQAGAWLTGKASRLKLGGPDDQSPLGHVETLEALGLGILGKMALWRLLRDVAPRHPGLTGIDFGGLEQRAKQQHDRVEARRLEAALEAL